MTTRVTVSMRDVFANAPIAHNWANRPTTHPVGYTLAPGILPDGVNVPVYDSIESLGAWLVGYLERDVLSDSNSNSKKEF